MSIASVTTGVGKTTRWPHETNIMDRSIFDDPIGVVPLEAARALQEGMTVQQVLDAIGPPKLRLSPDEAIGPTEIFRTLGFTDFRFDADDDIDAVWVYVHDQRGKFTLDKLVSTHLGFRDGIMNGTWQNTCPFPS